MAPAEKTTPPAFYESHEDHGVSSLVHRSEPSLHSACVDNSHGRRPMSVRRAVARSCSTDTTGALRMSKRRRPIELSAYWNAPPSPLAHS